MERFRLLAERQRAGAVDDMELAGALLLLVFVYPFQQGLIGFACFALLALVLFLANLVMTESDNPFDGICNISAKPFLDLLT